MNMDQGIKGLLHARQLLTVLSAQSASTYANQVIALVVPWLVLTRTGNAASAGTIAFVMGMAALAGTLAGGLVTDRIGGRRVSILADSLSLITALTLAVALWTDSFSLWLVAVTQMLGVFFDGPGQLVGPLMGAVIVPISALIFPAWFIFAQQDSRALGIFLGAGAVGGMVGGVTFAALAQKLPQRTWLVGAMGLYAWAASEPPTAH